MIEHINEIPFERLIEVFQEEFGFKGLHPHDYSPIVRVLGSRGWHVVESGISDNREWIIRIDNIQELITITKTSKEIPWVVDLRISMFFNHPDGWIDMPD